MWAAGAAALTVQLIIGYFIYVAANEPDERSVANRAAQAVKKDQ